MDWKKIAPWNWFRHEESAGVLRRRTRSDLARDPFALLRSEMERLSDDLFTTSAILRPSVDISESRKCYTVRAELPGMAAENVAIDVDGQTLVLRGEKTRETETEEEAYHCVERDYGAVQRVLTLPEDADCAAIDARFKNGVLTLRIAKQAPRVASGRRIEIQNG